MRCSKCGKVLPDEAVFCPQCGMPLNQADESAADQILYRLAENGRRSYSITVKRDCVLFDGKFWYLRDKEFIKAKNQQETARIEAFLGMGYLAKRSFKKCLLFVLAGSVLEGFKMILDQLTEWTDQANKYLQWIDLSVSLPAWLNHTMNILAVLCIILGAALFFSKKKVIEISFQDKRICVPQNSMTQKEYHTLYQSIQNAKKIFLRHG